MSLVEAIPRQLQNLPRSALNLIVRELVVMGHHDDGLAILARKILW